MCRGLRDNFISYVCGLLPGGATLYNMWTPHAPDGQCFEKASTQELKPIRVAEGTQVCLGGVGGSLFCV